MAAVLFVLAGLNIVLAMLSRERLHGETYLVSSMLFVGGVYALRRARSLL
jgi:hypothetical protein